MNGADDLLTRPIALVVALALVSLLPFAFMTLTAFVKISTVLQIVRSAIGAQSVPSNTVIARQPPVTVCSPMLCVVARLMPVSTSSDNRSTVGPVPVCTTARNAAAPVVKSGKDHAS